MRNVPIADLYEPDSDTGDCEDDEEMLSSGISLRVNIP